MPTIRSLFALVVAAVAAIALAQPAAAAPEGTPFAIAGGSTIRVSQTPSGSAPLPLSQASRRSISADGRFVVWTSPSADIVARDTNGMNDVFVYDAWRRTSRLVSHNAAGAASNGNSMFAQISSDGRVIVFTSTATDLPGAAGRAEDGELLYAYIVLTGWVIPISPVKGAAGRGITKFPRDALVVSATGRYVAFPTTRAFDPADTNGQYDVYRLDTITGAVRWVSVGNGPVDPGAFFIGGVSAAGSVVYSSASTTIVPVPGLTGFRSNLFLWNPRSGNKLVTLTPEGRPSDAGGLGGDISADGSTVTFASESTNLINEADPPRGFLTRLYVYRVATGALTRITEDFSGLPADRLTGAGAISASGRYVVYATYPYVLVHADAYILRYDTVTGRTTQLVRGTAEAYPGGISDDGRRMSFESVGTAFAPGPDTNTAPDVFLWTQRGSSAG